MKETKAILLLPKRYVRPLAASFFPPMLCPVLLSMFACKGPVGPDQEHDDEQYPAATDQLPDSGEAPAMTVHFESRTYTVQAAIPDDLQAYANEQQRLGATSMHVYGHGIDAPTRAQWAAWIEEGTEPIAFIGEQTWLIRANIAEPEGLARSLAAFGGTALSRIHPEDKFNIPLHQYIRAATRDASRSSVPIDVSIDLYETESEFPTELLNHGPGHSTGDQNTERSTPSKQRDGSWSTSATIDHLKALAAHDAVRHVSLSTTDIQTMDFARAAVRVDGVQRIDVSTTPPTYRGWSGKGVRMSNREKVYVDHDDFWTIDNAGNRIPRFDATPQPGVDCDMLKVGKGLEHGTMTAGIMLGNGQSSEINGRFPYQFRGMAPEATLVCPYNQVDVANLSWTDGSGFYDGRHAKLDGEIRGNDGPEKQILRVGASANQGIKSGSSFVDSIGYYSILRPQKNEITVGMVSPRDFRWTHSSLGPTYDGRIKPDIVAPGQTFAFGNGNLEADVEIDWIEVGSSWSLQTWDFSNQQNWHGGWAQDGWWGYDHINRFRQVSAGSGKSAAFTVLTPNPKNANHAKSPFIATLTSPNSTSPLSIYGNDTDYVRVRYRIQPNSAWNDPTLRFFWSDTSDSNFHARSLSQVVDTDGQWHTADFRVGEHERWRDVADINYLGLQFTGEVMKVPTLTNQSYGNASGSSAAAPVVAGAYALMLDQLAHTLDVEIGNKSWSPYFVNVPGIGVPLNSTFKALLIHTATDLISESYLMEPLNPDTGARTEYHAGPDLATGYGLVNVGLASMLIDSDARARDRGEPAKIIEKRMEFPDTHEYSFEVEPWERGPRRVTLVWDDAANGDFLAQHVPRLINDLDLRVISPEGEVFYPWSIEQPYQPTSSEDAPDKLEPEPISYEDIKPARRDRANRRDNVEQVQIDSITPGVWTVEVDAHALRQYNQMYSLVLGSP